MHNLIVQLFNKKGIKSIDELSQEQDPLGVSEFSTIQNYEKVLSKRELTVEDIKSFLTQQIEIIDNKWRDHSVSQKRKNELLPVYTVYKALLGAINAPDAERIGMERYLLNIINQ